MPAVAGFLSDGFDKYNGTGGAGSTSVGSGTVWNQPSGASLSAGRFGGQAIAPGSNWYIERNVAPGTTYTSFSIGVALYFNANTGSPLPVIGEGQTINGGSPTGLNLSIFWNSTGSFSLYNGYGGSLLGTSSAGLLTTTGTWGYLELFGVLGSGTSGSAGIAWNGSTIVNVTGVNTLPAGNALNIAHLGVYTQSIPWIFDDFYFNPSATPLGPVRVQTLYPTSNNSVGWTPLAGSNFSEANETHCDGDTTYNSATNVGTSDIYNFGSLPVTASQIFALSHVCIARNTGAVSRGIDLQCQSGATNEPGPTFTLGSGQYTINQRADLVDPNTSAAWTNAGVNAVGAGPYLAV